jgi:hypothetical protein
VFYLVEQKIYNKAEKTVDRRVQCNGKMVEEAVDLMAVP